MTADRHDTPISDSQVQRRYRDDQARLKLPRQSAPEKAATAESLEDMVQDDHRWLRFPAPLEAQFQADTLEPRRRLLIICGLFGILSIYLGTANIAELNPDIVPMAQRVAYLNLMACALGMLLVLPLPKRWRRTWQTEGVTALIAAGTCAGLINGCVFSRADTTFTHSAVLVTVVMYTCIAARQRFAWSLGCAALSFLGYVIFVKGFTPQQELIVAANIKLMALSFAFVLVANYTFERRERRNWLLRKLEVQRRAALVDTSERLRRLSTQDPLTGLVNRRQFDIDLARAWAETALARQPLSMLMVDVDFFKRYNDTYGHPAGDVCLIRVSQCLTTAARAHGGIATRLGGEEFGLLLPNRTLAQAMTAGADLCEAMRAAGIEHRASTVAAHVTVSVGAAQAWPDHGGVAESLVKLADQALYRSKGSGRDRTCAASAQDGAEQDSEPMPPTAEARDGQPPRQPRTPSADLDLDVGTTATSPVLPYLQTLGGKFRWLRFPAAQEADYRQHDAPQRRKLLLIVAVLGLVIYNLYILSSRVMFPDVPASSLWTLVGVSAFLLALTGVVFKLETLPMWGREAGFSAGVSATAVVTIWMLSQSQQLSALSFSVCLALIPMFSGVWARQPFLFTCLTAVITCLTAAVMLRPVHPSHALVFNDSLLMIVNNTVFTLILAYTLEYGARKEWLLSHIELLQRNALMDATQRLHALSMLDPLTGICNRRQFEADFERIWTEGLTRQCPVAMLIIDVDFFKLYNDGHGHPAGDRCLQQVASALNQAALPFQGLTARLGGEEFGILLSGATVEEAVQAGECVCSAIRAAGIEHRHSTAAHHVTVSVGVASLQPIQGMNRSLLLATADNALYQAKTAGRNRVATLDTPMMHRPTTVEEMVALPRT